MECSSMFFPIQVKQEIMDDSYEAPQSTLTDYYNATAHYAAQATPSSLPQSLTPIHIKHEPGLSDTRDSIGHHATSSLDGDPPRSSPLANASVPIPMVSAASGGIPPPQPVVDSPPNGTTPYAGHPDPVSVRMVPSPRSLTPTAPALLQHPPPSTSPKSSKKKKKKIKQEPIQEDMSSQMSLAGVGNMKKRMKQEKIPDTFKVRKKVDRFNGMPEEEVVKRTLPDHLTTDLDIVIIGINPGMFAAFKGHHYAGPGNHFWKCLYLSGLIPEPMTADDDFRLIEYGIGFTNIVARTTRGSADLARKEIREGAQILQEKMQKYRPKIAVFNGKGIYEVFSGRKNFDFGKQPEPIEGTNTLIYVMPSSSARCAQLPRAVDKVPFYVALRKLRDHLCGRLPLLRDAEVCFPDVKLKIESNSEEGAIKVEPADEDQDDLRYPGSTSMFEGPLSGPRTALLQSQRNFHQHPLGRAALAAAAAAGGYLEVSLARAGFTGTAPPGRSSKHSSSVVRDAKKKSSSSKKKKKKSDFGSHSASSCDSDPEVKRKIKMENSDSEAQGSCGTEHGTNDNGPCGSPQQHIQQRHHGALSGSPLGNEYRSPTPKPTPPVQHVQRPTPHPHPLSAYGSLSNTTYQTQMSPSPSLPTDHPPLYSSPVGPGYHSHHQTPLHIKQEKMDPMETSRLGSPSPSLNSTGAVSPSLLGGYPSPVGCLYSASGSATSNYGAGPPQAPSPYFGSPSPQNPYGSYHHSSLNPLLPLGHHHHHHAHQLAPPQGGPSHSSADLYASANGLHHHHHLQPMGTPHESQYYGVPGQGSGVNGAPYSPHMPHKDASPPTSVATAFHQYPSPSSAYHQHTHLHQPPNGAPPQYCPPPPLPDAGAVQNPTAITGVYDHQATSPAPLYTNLENVKVKQERLDPTYGEY